MRLLCRPAGWADTVQCPLHVGRKWSESQKSPVIPRGHSVIFLLCLKSQSENTAKFPRIIIKNLILGQRQRKNALMEQKLYAYLQVDLL